MRFLIAFMALFTSLAWSDTARADPCLDAIGIAQRTGDWRAAATSCRQAAKQDDPYAQQILGIMYFEGIGVPQDYAKARKWFRLAAERGLAESQHNLGLIYSNGLGVPRDGAEAWKWYKLAAEQGLAESQLLVGLSYKDMEPEAAVKWIRLAAEQGLAGAQASLADMYYMGNGVPRDHAEAAKWYQLAAAQGDIGAQDQLGSLYMRGRGVPRNYEEAAKWFHKVSERTGGRQSTLCSFYMEGKGVPQDDVLAHMRCSLSILLDDFSHESQRLRDELESRMTSVQIAKAEKLAREWMEEHPQFVPDPVEACDLGRRGVMYTRRSICGNEGGRPASSARTGSSD